MLNMEKLLAPVSPERPCGEDLAFSREIDDIVRARQADDPSLEQGAWVTELKEADWKFVAKQCAQLIEQRSKDLQLAVWLAEAAARTDGLRGLADSLVLVAVLCDRYWDGLYPLPDEDGHERRIGNLAWMASRIAPLLREIPLTEGQPGQSGQSGYALRDFDVARMRGGEDLAKLEAAKGRSASAFYEALLRDCEHCAGALERIERSIDERLGVDGPSFTAAKSGLQSVILFVKPMVKEGAKAAGAKPAGESPAAAPASQALQPAAPAEPTGGMPGGPPASRAQAIAQLREVAEFFRRSEPHSPVAYLAEKAAHWGEQPLHVWLRAVVKDDASFAHIEEMLGVAPPPGS